MLPFNKECVPEVDVADGYIVIAPPEGWIDNSVSSPRKRESSASDSEHENFRPTQGRRRTLTLQRSLPVSAPRKAAAEPGDSAQRSWGSRSHRTACPGADLAELLDDALAIMRVIEADDSLSAALVALLPHIAADQWQRVADLADSISDVEESVEAWIGLAAYAPGRGAHAAGN